MGKRKRKQSQTDNGSNDGGRSLQDRLSRNGLPSFFVPGPNFVPQYNLPGGFQHGIQNSVFSRTGNMSNVNENIYGMPSKIRRVTEMNNLDHSEYEMLCNQNVNLMEVPPQLPSTFSSNLQQRLGNNFVGGSVGGNNRGVFKHSTSRGRYKWGKQAKHSNKPSTSGNVYPKRSPYRGKKSGKGNSSTLKITISTDTKGTVKDDVEIPSEEQLEEMDPSIREENTSTSTKEEDVLSDALYCHICDIKTFHKKTHNKHLGGAPHGRLAKKYHEKCAALLEYLTISAEFAEMKRKDKIDRSTGKEDIHLARITEKIILDKYQKFGKCCGKQMSTLFNRNIHQLSVQHLLKQHRIDMERKTNEVEEPNRGDIDEMIKAAKDAAVKDPPNVSNIQHYDAKTLFGMHYIEKTERYKCTICKGQNHFMAVEDHCMSHKHYEHFIEILNNEEEKKVLEQQKKISDEGEEDSKETVSADIKQLQKHANRNEDDCKTHTSDNENQNISRSNEDCMKDGAMFILGSDNVRDLIVKEEPQTNSDELNDNNTISDIPQTVLEEKNDNIPMRDKSHTVLEQTAGDLRMSENSQTVLDEKNGDIAMGDISETVLDDKNGDISISDKSETVMVEKNCDISISNKSKTVLDEKNGDITMSDNSQPVLEEENINIAVIGKSPTVLDENNDDADEKQLQVTLGDVSITDDITVIYDGFQKRTINETLEEPTVEMEVPNEPKERFSLRRSSRFPKK